MAIEYGLTDTGLVIKTLSVIIEEKEQEIRAQFGDSANIDPESVFGQLINISAERESELWELLEQIYLAQYPISSFGGSLDQAVSLNGLIRDGLRFSTVSLQAFWGLNTAVIPAGTILSVDGNSSAQYSLNDEVVLGPGVNQVQTITLSPTPVLGTWTLTFKDAETIPLDFDATNTEVKNALEAMQDASGNNVIDGVSVTGDYTTFFEIDFDGENVEFRKNPILVVGVNTLLVSIAIVISIEGIYQGEGLMTAVEGGAGTAAPIYTLIDFVNSIPDISRTSNEVAASNGADRESDANLKIRRDLSLSAFGGGTGDAVTAAVLNIDAVASCLVYENDTIFTDPFGRPPKSFEAFVLQKTELEGGSPSSVVDQLVGEAIFQNKPLGIQTFGNGSVPEIFVVDTNNNQKSVNFSRPVTVDIFLIWELTTDPAIFPVDGATQIGNAVIEYGNGLGQGVDVIVSPYLLQVLSEFLGITDTVTKIGTSPAPTTDDNVVIDNGAGGQVEISVWTGPNISFVINGTSFTFNPTTEEWES